ncbi:MarR family transcriptional regulator [Mycobacterium sp. 21AC1]|uniref:MarR family winged helix-turn-helix transcriptional regulator n=1 Tax=[Mycobacterium] appelbergii TaxID=2939269 RepID=UPI002938E0D4|nr:MarR family transcriptional regulator [Mycobacterium sp. 21AC1]MDV3129537.1 MarR family transcriptional regulator [Mycobacterium sp. 21AC1]
MTPVGSDNATHLVDALAVDRVAGLLRRAVRDALEGSDLTLDQWRVIDHLAAVEEAAMSSVSALTLIPGPSLTRTVDRLVDAALVYRTLDSYDRRRMMVRLSERGVEKHRALAPSVSAALQEVFSPLTSAEMWAFSALLGKLSG